MQRVDMNLLQLHDANESGAMPRLLVAPCLLPAFLLTASGCATVSHEARAPVTVLSPRGVVFVADGAGGGNSTSGAMRQLLQESNVPLSVDPLNWSHGYGRYIADQRDRGYARDKGRELAGRIMEYRSLYPTGEVYLVGHSAGATVLLDAAEALPPGSIERIILLAPSVSAERDLRPALRTVRVGIDVFYSQRDQFYLGIATGLIGTADGRWRDAAGRVGFRPKIETPEDAALVTKLQQHPWHPAVEWTGNRGGHFGGNEIRYLRAYVLPLLSTSSYTAREFNAARGQLHAGPCRTGDERRSG
jgi:pimeloyl-ACP methyl ester carboxylesterase